MVYLERYGQTAKIEVFTKQLTEAPLGVRYYTLVLQLEQVMLSWIQKIQQHCTLQCGNLDALDGVLTLEELAVPYTNQKMLVQHGIKFMKDFLKEN